MPYYSANHQALFRYLRLPTIAGDRNIGSDLAFWLAQRGDSVCVVASRQRFDDPLARLASWETVEGVEVYRVRTSRFGRHFLPGRAVDYLTFYLSASFRLWRLALRGDVVVAKTDPPLVSVVTGWVCRLRGAELVNWLQDLFPEVAVELGIRGLDGWPGRFLRRLRSVVETGVRQRRARGADGWAAP